jgi:hypothetical protein
MEVIIDNEKYVIEKANIDVSKFDYEGICEEYKGCYVVIEAEYEGYDTRDIKVREFDGSVYDDNNHSKYGSFDPDNYSEDIHARLENGDECYVDELYTIISTTNSTGSVYYDYLKKSYIHDDLLKKYKND